MVIKLRKEKIYKIRYNEKGEKVCVIKGEELKIISEKDGIAILENGKRVNLFSERDRQLDVDTSDEVGQTIIKAVGGTVLFNRTAPSKGMKDGKTTYYRLVSSPKKVLSNKYDRITGPYEEIRVNENEEEGTANISTKISGRQKEAECLINYSGGLQTGVNDETYVRIIPGERIIIPPRPTPSVLPNSKKTNNASEKNKESKPKDNKLKRRIAALLLLPIPIILVLRQCGRQPIPEPEPIPGATENGDSDPTIDPKDQGGEDINRIDGDSIIINDENIQYIINILENENINPELINILEKCYENSEEIMNDINNWMEGDKDVLVKELLGDEFVGTSTSDGVPSSFHKVLNDKYYNMTEEEWKNILDVTNISTICRLSPEEMKQLLDDSQISYTEEDLKDSVNLNNLKLKLIQQYTGYDLKKIDDLKEVSDIFEEYFTKQEQMRKESIGLTEKHKETTEQSIGNRPEDGKKSYTEEAVIHDVSESEQHLKLAEDERTLEIIKGLKSLYNSKIFESVYYSMQNEGQIGQDKNGIGVER